MYIISEATMWFNCVVCYLVELFTKVIIFSTAAKCNEHSKINVFGCSEINRLYCISFYLNVCVCGFAITSLFYHQIWCILDSLSHNHTQKHYEIHSNNTLKEKFTIWWELVEAVSSPHCFHSWCTYKSSRQRGYAALYFGSQSNWFAVVIHLITEQL